MSETGDGGPTDSTRRFGQVALTTRRWAWLAEYAQLSGEDMGLLADAAPLAAIGELAAESFYDHVRRYPELRTLIETNSTADRLRAKLAAHVRSYFSGSFDDDRVDALVRIGRVHERIGVPLTCYLGAILQLDSVVIDGLVNRYGDDPCLLDKLLIAYRRLSACDAAIITQTYHEAVAMAGSAG